MIKHLDMNGFLGPFINLCMNIYILLNYDKTGVSKDTIYKLFIPFIIIEIVTTSRFIIASYYKSKSNPNPPPATSPTMFTIDEYFLFTMCTYLAFTTVVKNPVVIILSFSIPLVLHIIYRNNNREDKSLESYGEVCQDLNKKPSQCEPCGSWINRYKEGAMEGFFLLISAFLFIRYFFVKKTKESSFLALWGLLAVLAAAFHGQQLIKKIINIFLNKKDTDKKCENKMQYQMAGTNWIHNFSYLIILPVKLEYKIILIIIFSYYTIYNLYHGCPPGSLASSIIYNS